MALSVVVTSFESPDTLRKCLESLASQAEATEIVVSDCSTLNPALLLQQRFPRVRFLHSAEQRSVPWLRWAGFAVTHGSLIAATEARCVPSASWCRQLIAAHQRSPVSPVVGGTVTIASGASLFDYALYLCEYGAYAPPVQEGPAESVSGANLSYRREALQQLTENEWETAQHQRWCREGRQLWQSSATVEFHNSMSVSNALRQRWHYGKGYAADRVEHSSLPVRMALGVASLALPALLCSRIARHCARRGSLQQFAPSLGWILLLTVAWSCGEMAGYLGGKPTAARIF